MTLFTLVFNLYLLTLRYIFICIRNPYNLEWFLLKFFVLGNFGAIGDSTWICTSVCWIELRRVLISLLYFCSNIISWPISILIWFSRSLVLFSSLLSDLGLGYQDCVLGGIGSSALPLLLLLYDNIVTVLYSFVSTGQSIYYT
jgi:hypothetical protein